MKNARLPVHHATILHAYLVNWVIIYSLILPAAFVSPRVLSVLQREFVNHVLSVTTYQLRVACLVYQWAV